MFTIFFYLAKKEKNNYISEYLSKENGMKKINNKIKS